MTVTIPFSIELADGTEIVYSIELDGHPSTPDVMYLSNGDPGHPGDPAECEIITISLECPKQNIEIPGALWLACGFTDHIIEQVIEKGHEKIANWKEDEEDARADDRDSTGDERNYE